MKKQLEIDEKDEAAAANNPNITSTKLNLNFEVEREEVKEPVVSSAQKDNQDEGEEGLEGGNGGADDDDDSSMASIFGEDDEAVDNEVVDVGSKRQYGQSSMTQSNGSYDGERKRPRNN